MTERSAVALAAAIAAGEASSTDVVGAHIDVLRHAQPRTNAVVADRFDAALDEARRADERVAQGGALPPLLGVPFTVKESVMLRGMPNAAGVVSRRELRSERTAPAVQRLIEAGAIPLAVTNTPELCLWYECENRLYGRTSNAYDPSRIAGGSSGGEGAAVGSGGAPFGIGSDIGGSVRLPAFFNGVFGHKASANVIPLTGQWPVPDTEEQSRWLTIGPLARRAEDLMPLLRLMAGPDGEDQLCRDVAFGDPGAVDLDGLPVAVIDRGGPLPVQGELVGALYRAAGALETAGATVRTVRIPALRRTFELFVTLLGAGEGTPFLEIVGDGTARRRGEIFAEALRRSSPHTWATLMLIAADALPKPGLAVRRARTAAQRLREQVLEAIGDGVLLYPPHPRVAPRHGQTKRMIGALAYTQIFNLLELPATQAPAGIGRAGLPLGLQVVGAPDADHVTIGVTLELERALGGWVPPAQVVVPQRRSRARRTPRPIRTVPVSQSSPRRSDGLASSERARSSIQA